MMNVFVVGGIHHNTIGVIRSLGRVGIHPYLILTNGNIFSSILRSRYIKKRYLVKGSYAAVSLLLQKFAKEDEKSVLIACHDGIASVFDQNRDILSKYFHVPGTREQGFVTQLQNKQLMGDFARRSGLCVPAMDVMDIMGFGNHEKVGYPCITKPVSSNDGTKSDIFICRDDNDLRTFLEHRKPRKFVVQEYINKDFEFQLIGCSLHGGQNVIIPGVSQIIYCSRNSNTGYLHYMPLDESYDDTVRKTKDFIRSVGYSGLFSVEFLRDRNCKDFFMEINFRNDGNAICVTNAGVNLPYIWVLSCLGVGFQNEIRSVHEEYVVPDLSMIYLYLNGSITKNEWSIAMEQATSYMDYAKDDPMPTFGWCRYYVRNCFAKLKYKIKKL